MIATAAAAPAISFCEADWMVSENSSAVPATRNIDP